MGAPKEHSAKMKVLKHLLMDEDLEHIDRIDKELKEILNDFYVEQRFEEKVDPIIETRLDGFKRSIPDTMGPAITAALRKQVKESQKEVVDALYPLIGRMISKYIRKEIEALSNRLDEQFANAFSFEGWERRFKAWFSGSKESEMMIRATIPAEIEEIFIIKKGSGILLGQYSHQEQIDGDMIAGMLTAIKSFSEDAFRKDSSELELIEYESYKIKIYNFSSFYIAVIISGVLSVSFEEDLKSGIMDFVEKYMRSDRTETEASGGLNELMKKHFSNATV